jgi:membrane-bound ClpP family serine protease
MSAVMEAVLVFGLLACGPTRASAQTASKKDGIFITVPNPITDGAVNHIKRKVDDALKRRGKTIAAFTVVFDFNPHQLPAGTSNFGSCHDLAEFIRNLRLGQISPSYPRIHTIAFVDNEVSKHTVLAVLACGDLVMSGTIDNQTMRPRARLGDVLRDQEGLSRPAREAYEIVAENYSRGLVFRLIDRDLVVKKVKTKDGVRYFTEEEINKRTAAGETLTVQPDVPPGLEVRNTVLDAERARDYGLCKAIYNTRAELARALDLPHRSLSEDWLGDRTVIAWVVEIRGELDQGKIESLRRRVKTAIGRNANLIILQLDCEGGATVDSATMARELNTLTDDQGMLPVKTIAYVPPGRSLGAATFLALGCNDIVMAQNAFLGDFSYLADKTTDALKPKRAMLVELAKQQGYPPLLFEAMLDPDLVLYRVQSRADPGAYQLVTEGQLKQDERKQEPAWHAAGRIDKPEGQFLKLDAKLAKEWGVAQYSVDSLESLYALYDLDPAKVRVSRDDWLDKIAEFFREPIVNVVLIMLGIIGLILELKMPGVGFPGIMSAVCFVLFFWAYSFVGEFTMLAVLLFVLGLILIGIEVFVLPGFGITGISGIVLVVGSLALVTLEKMPETTQDWVGLGLTLATFGVSLAGAIAAAFMLAWYLPHIPYANRLVLAPPTEETGEMLTSGGDNPIRPDLLGAIGVAETTLRPAGKARFGDEFLDVIAEGDYVNPGSRVQVIEIEGNRIVVKQV